MVRKYRVWPAEEEQQELGAPTSRGRAAAYRRTHARYACLACEEGLEPAPAAPGRAPPDCPGPGPPEGPAGWTLRLPADRVRRTGVRERTEAPVLQRGRLRLRERSRIPRQGNAEFVCDGVYRRTISASPAGRGIPGRESLTERVP